MKKVLMLLIILILTGCSYSEISDIAIISTLSIDKIDNKYKIIVQVLDTKKSTTEMINPSVVLYESTGNTIHEAYRNISLESSKKLYIGHLKTVIVKDIVFKDNTNEFIDFVLRNNEIDKSFDILLTKENIEDIMEIIPPLEPIPSEKISNSLDIASRFQGMVDVVRFDKFIGNIYAIGIDPVLPVIEIKKVNSNNKEINPDKRLVLSKNLAIFKDYKFINYLSEEATIGFNLLNKSDTSSIISFKCDNNNYASVELIDVKPNINYESNSNKYIINLNITSKLNELNCKNSKEELESQFKLKVKDIINTTIKEEKDNNADYLGIESYLYKNNYKYHNITDLIKNMDININVNNKFDNYNRK